MTVAFLLPFVGKAFHVDDPFFVEAARQIRTNPLDFYGRDFNWWGTSQPMAEVAKNPPVTPFFIALVTAIAGEREISLHIAFLIPAVAATIGILVLARRFCRRPLAPALAAIATPVFVVSSTNVMCDTMQLAFWVWAVETWLRAHDSGRAGTFVASGLLVTLAALTKYVGIGLIPLLFAHGLARTRRLGPWTLALGIPLLALAGYDVWTRELYGRGLLSDAVGYSKGVRLQTPVIFSAKPVAGLSFAGGCFVTVAFLAPWLWSRRAILAGAAAGAAFLLAVAAIGRLGHYSLEGPDGLRWGLIVQLTIFTLAGASLLALAVLDLVHGRDADALLLCLWIFGIFVFAVFLNWSLNARSLLSATPAVGILIARRLESRGVDRLPVVPLVLAAILSLAVAWADARLAASAREAAGRFTRELGAGPGRLWFEGHWGFQYYMEAGGARPLDMSRSKLSAGDHVVVPMKNTNLFDLPRTHAAIQGRVDFPVVPFLATVAQELGAGFYADWWGPLPYAFGRVPVQPYVVVGITRDLQLEKNP
ncbi:MAG TPA: glycosyltransferase family 39 protein [Thermoanaerobaculia bacterium]